MIYVDDFVVTLADDDNEKLLFMWKYFFQFFFVHFFLNCQEQNSLGTFSSSADILLIYSQLFIKNDIQK